MLFKRLAAGIPALALAAAVGVAVLPAATAAGGEPLAPVITLTPASCENNENLLDVSNLSETDASQYRFVLMVNGTPSKQLNRGERAAVLSGTARSAENLLGAVASHGYGSSVAIKAYWFNNGKNGAFKFTDRTEETINLMVGSPLTKAVALSDSNTITLTNPDTLDCAPPASEEPGDTAGEGQTGEPQDSANTSEGNTQEQGGGTASSESSTEGQNSESGTESGTPNGTENAPGSTDSGSSSTDAAPSESPKLKGMDDLPVAPVFELSAAHCEANKAVDNAMTISSEKKDFYRFVVSQDGRSLGMGSKLTPALWQHGKLTTADIKAAYPSFTLDYTKPVSVQAYWFDQAKEFDPNLYDTALRLEVGKSDRYIKLGEAKTLTAVDKDSLDCEPKKPEVTIGGVAPSADTKPAFVAGTSVKAPITIKGFTPLAKVDIYIHSEPVFIGTFTANEKGEVNFDLTVPAAVAAGEHTLVMTEEGSTKPALEVPITVTKALTDKPAAPTFTLAAAKCEGTSKVDNVMTVDPTQKNELLRFVATYNGVKVSLKTSLREKLWTTGQLTAADIQDAYPSLSFDYTKPLSVQAYWFDQKGLYSTDLYDTTVGKDRFIALGEAKTLTLVDPASLTCTVPDPVIPDPVQPEITIGAAAGSDVTPTLVADGTTATAITAKGFAPESDIRVEIHSDPVLIGTFKADQAGVVKFDLLVPTSVPAGAHKLVLTEVASKKAVSADIIVKAAEKSEPSDPKKDDDKGETKQPETTDPKKDENKGETKQPEKKDSGKPSQTITPEKKDAKQNPKEGDATTTSPNSTLAKTGFESGMVSLAGLLTLCVGAAAMATSRKRARR